MVVAVRAVFIATPRQPMCPDGGMLRCTHASSNSRASLRKAFLHFLQMKVMSKVCMSGWLDCSSWHWAQSNHFLPVPLPSEKTPPCWCFLVSSEKGRRTAGRADRDLGVENVLAAWTWSAGGLRRWLRRGAHYHMVAVGVSSKQSRYATISKSTRTGQRRGTGAGRRQC